MKRVIKLVLSESIKRKLRRIEDLRYRLGFGFTQPVILEDSYGVKFILPSQDRNPIRWQLAAGTNKQEFDAIRSIVKEGSVVFDVGANIGMLSVFMARLVGQRGKVFAFEPHPSTRKELRKTLALNEIENVTIVPIALSSDSGNTVLYTVGTNYKLSSLGPIADTTYGENKTIDIHTDTLDHFCTEHGIDTIDFLKIDVEGFEFDVLQGAQHMLDQKKIKAMQFEMWEKNDALLDFVEKNGYTIDYSLTNASNYYAFAH